MTVALEKRNYRGEEHQWYCVDMTIDEIEPKGIDLLIIPGGDSSSMFNNKHLKKFIEQVAAGGGKIGGICGGSELMAALGILDGKRCTGNTTGVKPTDSVYPYYENTNLLEEHVVVDGNIITAQGQAFIQFAVEIARQAGTISDDKDFEETLNWFKNIRD